MDTSDGPTAIRTGEERRYDQSDTSDSVLRRRRSRLFERRVHHRFQLPEGGPAYFDIAGRGQPGIGRNSFRGPRYLGVDAAFSKNVRFAERVHMQLRANVFNVFNKLNLVPLSFGTESTMIENPNFGRSSGSLAGRVIEFQGRLVF